jgi:hypothetical protein
MRINNIRSGENAFWIVKDCSFLSAHPSLAATIRVSEISEQERSRL